MIFNINSTRGHTGSLLVGLGPIGLHGGIVKFIGEVDYLSSCWTFSLIMMLLAKYPTHIAIHNTSCTL